MTGNSVKRMGLIKSQPARVDWRALRVAGDVMLRSNLYVQAVAIPDRANALEDALDLLADGVALLRRDGGIV